MNNELVTLVSSDGVEFELEYKDIKIARTVQQLVEDIGTDTSIPLMEVKGNILEKVVEYCKHHSNKSDSDRDDVWDKEFMNVDQNIVFELILASNYMDISSLLDLSCQKIANMIKGKSTEEIRTMFDIEDDFTPQEKEKIKKENEWINA